MELVPFSPLSDFPQSVRKLRRWWCRSSIRGTDNFLMHCQNFQSQLASNHWSEYNAREISLGRLDIGSTQCSATLDPTLSEPPPSDSWGYVGYCKWSYPPPSLDHCTTSRYYFHSLLTIMFTTFIYYWYHNAAASLSQNGGEVGQVIKLIRTNPACADCVVNL